MEQTNDSMDGVIMYLQELLSRRFYRDISRIYYGDIGVYLPSAFGSSRREQKAVIALSPVRREIVEGSRTGAGEDHILHVDIIVMVNITPFFEANPEEAYGERTLVRTTTDIANFLALEENLTLDGRVRMTKIGDIDWAWLGKNDQAIRAAAIAFQARVNVKRVDTL